MILSPPFHLSRPLSGLAQLPEMFPEGSLHIRSRNGPPLLSVPVGLASLPGNSHTRRPDTCPPPAGPPCFLPLSLRVVGSVGSDTAFATHLLLSSASLPAEQGWPYDNPAPHKVLGRLHGSHTSDT